MAEETPHPTIDPEASISQPTHAFEQQWQPPDAAAFAPSHLAVSKVTRAWERRPLSPFSRSRVRVGKVWKRARPVGAMRLAASTREQGEDGFANERRKGRSSLQGGMKPIKKMCMDEGFGVGARVVGWEGVESPERKIVTRSRGEEELVELVDEEVEIVGQDEVEDEEEGDVTIEILDEDGTVLEINPEDGGQEAGWQDEVEEEEDDDVGGMGSALMDAYDVDTASDAFTNTVETVVVPIAQDARDTPVEADAADIRAAEARDTSLEAQIAVKSQAEKPVAPVFTFGTAPRSVQNVVLPEGFVSPAKQPARRTAKQYLFGSRRRTLPVQFAPDLPTPTLSAPLQEQYQPAEVEGQPAESADSDTISHSSFLEVEAVESDEAVASDAQDMDQEWEDVEESGSDFEMMETEKMLPSKPEAQAITSENDMAETIHISTPTTWTTALVDDATSAKLPSSPVPTIEGQHPGLPLRRSPRRKSTSPLKQSSLLPTTERSHLIAFTPLKPAPRLRPVSDAQPDTSMEEAEDHHASPSSPIERASSAPPEEPQMSPRKPFKPRISDDTALLQAFLNRAAENKNRGSRRMSATVQESIENRRDSDAVRHALASPAKPEVLGELDVNSPSPRKTAAKEVLQSEDGGFGQVGLQSGATDLWDQIAEQATRKRQDDQEEQEEQQRLIEEEEAAPVPGSRTRRSGRTSRKPQTATPAPNKISIKGSASDGIVLRRSEAQEMALLTRNNTKKNKGASVLPPLRLTKMVMQFGNPDPAADNEIVDEATEEPAPEGRRGVRWAEVLVEYSQGGEVSDSSILSDELSASVQSDAADKIDAETATPAIGLAAAPPPAETPSKPKMRKLKAPRTAAAPGRTPLLPAPTTTAAIDDAEKPDTKTTAAAKSTASKRRSRIATPAKGLTNASLLPSDLDPQPVVPEPKVAPTKRKAPVSKLPAPAGAQASTSAQAPSNTASLLGQGKENTTSSLLASPPKKKAMLMPPPPTAGGKGFAAPKLDLGSKLDLAPKMKLAPVSLGAAPGLGGIGSGASGGADERAVPGLMSPAKKGGRGRMMGCEVGKGDFGGGNGSGNGGGGDEGVERLGLGLSSPAKKRTRRAL